MSEMSVAARWIVPVSSPPLENGRLIIAGGRIASLESHARPQTSDVDYGDAVILPGFVNAHTHLELTRFRGCAPYLGSFTDWLRIVVSLQTANGAEEIMGQAVGEGFRQSLGAGVTTIVDTGCGGRAIDQWRQAPLNVVGLVEAIGMGPRVHDTHPRSIRSAMDVLEIARGGDSLMGVGAMRGGKPRGSLSLGISPHAPYSTAPEVYRQAIAYAREHGLMICTHLAETHEEVEFLAHGTGPFRKLLEERGLWDGSFTPPGCSPVEYAETLGLLACRPLLAHGNYVSDADIDLLAQRNCSVACCPRTHQFFQHEPHPYRRMLERNVNVCIGTDSLASAPSLSILDELRFLRRIDPTCESNTLLEMGTIRGARAAGLESRLGSLEAGKQADLVVVPLTRPGTTAPVDDLLRGTAQPVAVWLAGKRLQQ